MGTNQKLNDCTLIIPVRFDSPDRINNVTIVINYINYFFNTNILICEHDADSKFEKNFPDNKNVTHMFIKSDSELFYKTKCINEAVKAVTTSYFAIYDADILLTYDQMIKSIEALNQGWETVYPYDGTFLNVPKYYFNKIINENSLSHIDNSACKRGLGMSELTSDRQSFGGCVFFNKASFIKYGMANENIVSYGPEDCEIAYRFRLLSKFGRIAGPLYHLEHVRYLNSNENHSYVEQNHAEFRKVLNMNKEQLINYIISWEWNK